MSEELWDSQLGCVLNVTSSPAGHVVGDVLGIVESPLALENYAE